MRNVTKSRKPVLPATDATDATDASVLPATDATDATDASVLPATDAPAAPAAIDATDAPAVEAVEAVERINPKIAARATDAGNFFARALPAALPVFVAPASAGHMRDRALRGSSKSSPASMLRAAATLAAIARYNGTTLHAIAAGDATVTLPLYRAGEQFAMQSGAASDTCNRLGTTPDCDDNGLHVTPDAAKRAIAYLPRELRAIA